MPTMFTVIRTMSRYGKARSNYVPLPLTPSLLDEPGFTAGRKYLVLPDEPEPPPAKPPPRKWGAQPRWGGREVIEME